jgi:hypothetical protein
MYFIPIYYSNDILYFFLSFCHVERGAHTKISKITAVRIVFEAQVLIALRTIPLLHRINLFHWIREGCNQ